MAKQNEIVKTIFSRNDELIEVTALLHQKKVELDELNFLIMKQSKAHKEELTRFESQKQELIEELKQLVIERDKFKNELMLKKEKLLAETNNLNDNLVELLKAISSKENELAEFSEKIKLEESQIKNSEKKQSEVSLKLIDTQKELQELEKELEVIQDKIILEMDKFNTINSELQILEERKKDLGIWERRVTRYVKELGMNIKL